MTPPSPAWIPTPPWWAKGRASLPPFPWPEKAPPRPRRACANPAGAGRCSVFRLPFLLIRLLSSPGKRPPETDPRQGQGAAQAGVEHRHEGLRHQPGVPQAQAAPHHRRHDAVALPVKEPPQGLPVCPGVPPDPPECASRTAGGTWLPNSPNTARDEQRVARPRPAQPPPGQRPDPGHVPPGRQPDAPGDGQQGTVPRAPGNPGPLIRPGTPPGRRW